MRALLQLRKSKAIAQAPSKIRKFLHLLCTLLPPPQSLSGEVEGRYKCSCSISLLHQMKLYLFISKKLNTSPSTPRPRERYDESEAKNPNLQGLFLILGYLNGILLLILWCRRIPIIRVTLIFILAIPTSH